MPPPGDVSAFLARILRPWPLYLLLCLVGWIVLLHRSSAAWMVAALFAVPVLYCLALDWAGIAIFDRFLYPALIAAQMLAATAYAVLWRESSRRMIGRSVWVVRAALILIAAFAWGVAARDAYHVRTGYLRQEAAARREFREALSRIPDGAERQAKFLVTGHYFAATALQIRVGADRIEQDAVVYAMGGDAERVAEFDYLLLESGSPVFHLLGPAGCEGGECVLRAADKTFEMIWGEPGGAISLFARRSNTTKEFP